MELFLIDDDEEEEEEDDDDDWSGTVSLITVCVEKICI